MKSSIAARFFCSLVAVAIPTVFAATIAAAQPDREMLSGEDLVSACKSSEPVNKARCEAYIAGAMDMLTILGEETSDAKLKRLNKCVPENLRPSTVSQWVLQLVESNSGYGQVHGAFSYRMALMIGLKCK